jgi:hypothetical protein
MARPLVLIFQELAQPQAVINTPDLSTIIIGPAYDLFDYPDDGATILLADTYGVADAAPTATPPVAGSNAVTVLDGGYPGQSAGSKVDHESVVVTFRLPRVILGATYAITGAQTLGTSVTTASSDRTLLTLAGAATNFVDSSLKPGDTVYLKSSTGQTCQRTVQSVGEPNGDGLATDGLKLRLTSELPASGGGAGQWTYGTLGEIRVERTLNTQLFVDDGTYVTFPEAGSDKMVLKGGITLSAPVTPVASVATPNPTTTTLALPLSYAGIYLGYRALRQDLQAVGRVTATSITTIGGVPVVNGVGKIDARNPLAVGLSLALQNAGSNPIFYYGVISDDASGHLAARGAVEIRRDLYCFVPLTQDLNIHAAYKAEFVQMADPTYALANGLIQKFRIVLGSVPLPTTSSIYSGTVTGVAQTQTGANTGKFRTLVIDTAATGSTSGSDPFTNLSFRNVLPGDTITIGLVPTGDATWQSRRGSHLVSHVNASLDYPSGSVNGSLELLPGSSRWDDTQVSPNGDIEFLIVGPDGTKKAWNYATLSIAGGTGAVKYTMKNPTPVGGPYTVQYASGVALAVSISGFAILVTFITATTTNEQVAAAINADPVISTILTATQTGTAGQVVTTTAATDIMPTTGGTVASVAANDDLYIKLEDTSATFITAGVKPGDTVRVPINPNDYSPSAFAGRLLTYKVGSVLNEQHLLISNGFDDSPSASNELPHGFARDIQDRIIDNTAPNAQTYDIVRALSKDDQVLSLATVAQSVRSARLTLMWPDLHGVNDLRDGSLPRSLPSVRTLAGRQPSYFLACAVGGVICAIPPQAGMTNGSFIGIGDLAHAQGYFDERQLSQISDSGFFTCVQRTPGALPECIHQLTTDPTTLETGEVSVVKNVDFLALFFQGIIEPFLGQYNVLQETADELNRAAKDGADSLKSRRVARVGPPLISGGITSISFSDFSADRIEMYFNGKVARPLNTVGFHLVV